LRTVGLRLNQSRPDITMKEKPTGGIVFASTCPVTKMGDDPKRVVYQICKEYKINNAEILFRGDYNTDDFIDAIEGNRHYVKALYVYNKIDQITIEKVNELAR
jgi:ribosome-interacting GTPase 1